MIYLHYSTVNSANTHAHSSVPPAAPIAYGRGLMKIGARLAYSISSARIEIERKRKMTEEHSFPSSSPLGSPSCVLQQKVAAEGSPTDRVERLLKKYKVGDLYLS